MSIEVVTWNFKVRASCSCCGGEIQKGDNYMRVDLRGDRFAFYCFPCTERALRGAGKAEENPKVGGLDGPAFPTNAINHSGFEGMSLRAYAAIHLKLPDPLLSDELNAKIRQARRLDLAAEAMPAVIAWGDAHANADKAAAWSLEFADAVLAESDKGGA